MMIKVKDFNWDWNVSDMERWINTDNISHMKLHREEETVEIKMLNGDYIYTKMTMQMIADMHNEST